jgi:aminopeptidase YwaD
MFAARYRGFMKQYRLVFFLLLFTSAAFAQSAGLEKNLRTHVEYLASQKLEGRRTGEKGATDAANYVAAQFAKFKLTPGIRPNFLQPFPYIAGVTLGGMNSLRIVPSDTTREQKMDLAINWMPLGYSPNADIPMTDVVFVGFGVVAPEANHDDYRGHDVRDKIVLMYDSTPDAGNPHSAFSRFNIHTKANIAKDKGALAIILIAAEDDFKNDRLSRLSYDRTLGETALPVVGIMRDHATDLLAKTEGETQSEDEAAKRKDIAAQAGATAALSAQPEKKEPAAVNARQSQTGIKAQIKISLKKNTVTAYNAIAILPGNDPLLKSEAIIIGAHYDHLGHGGSGSLAANSNDIHFGADDNASGTSAVIELARGFAATKKNKRTIIFMAFGGEEEGLLGSKHYVNNPVWPLDKTIAMINLDMVGRLNENKLTVGGIGTASEWKAIVEGKNAVDPKLVGASLNSIPVPLGTSLFQLALNEDGFGPSDHSSFYGKQIPVLFLFTGTHTDYHKPTDTSEKINYAGLSRIASFVEAIVKSVDQSPAKPTYAVAKSSGQMGQVGLSVSLGTIPSYGDTTDGMILDGVRDGSPAAKAGLKAGDKILKLAGKDVRNAMDYTYVLSSMKAGEEYEVELIRGTERMTLKVIPAPAARRP